MSSPVGNHFPLDNLGFPTTFSYAPKKQAKAILRSLQDFTGDTLAEASDFISKIHGIRILAATFYKLYPGKFTKEGLPQSLYNTPNSIFTQGFENAIKKMNDMRSAIKPLRVVNTESIIHDFLKLPEYQGTPIAIIQGALLNKHQICIGEKKLKSLINKDQLSTQAKEGKKTIERRFVPISSLYGDAERIKNSASIRLTCTYGYWSFSGQGMADYSELNSDDKTKIELFIAELQMSQNSRFNEKAVQRKIAYKMRVQITIPELRNIYSRSTPRSSPSLSTPAVSTPLAETPQPVQTPVIPEIWFPPSPKTFEEFCRAIQ